MSDLIVNIPFPGFYESLLSGELDSIEEREAENMAEQETSAEYYPDTYQPAELRLDESAYASMIFDCMNYSAAHATLARDYADTFNDVASDEVGFPLGLRFESMTSPRYYNFETDRLFCYVPEETVSRLFEMSAAEKHERLAAAIKERFTSRSGFISGYDNDLAEWLEKPVLEWDHNELGTLLRALLPDEESRGESIEWKCYYAMADSECFYNAFNDAMDWRKFGAAVQEAREEKQAELSESDPDYVAPPPRCPNTLDLFGGRNG
jgi:hypothetical protein